jgi:hypothetical protein
MNILVIGVLSILIYFMIRTIFWILMAVMISYNSKGSKTTIQFLWYDFWRGAFFDKNNKIIYICPISTWVFKIEMEPK